MLISVSANHHTTPFETLDRLSDVGESIAATLRNSHEHIRGAVVLATCNRFEAYLDVDEDSASPSPEPATTAALHDLATLAGIPFRQLRDEVTFAHGNGVARHLFAVSAGLESIAVGEGEIAGQVRRSLEASRAQGLTTPSLEQLFQRATETSKHVKNDTALSESGRSLVTLALELASSRIADWRTARVLLIGTGRYAAVTLASARSLGATNIRVASASPHGAHFAEAHGVPLVDDFNADVIAADLIIACTTREGYALEPEHFGDREAADQRPQLVVDLGMPRNVNPTVAELAHIALLDLETIRIHAPINEFAHLAAAQDIVDSAALKYGNQQREQEVAAAIVQIRQMMYGLVETELARGHKDSAIDSEIEQSLRHFAGVLLHRIITAGQSEARSGHADQWMASVGHVFGLETGTRRNKS